VIHSGRAGPDFWQDFLFILMAALAAAFSLPAPTTLQRYEAGGKLGPITLASAIVTSEVPTVVVVVRRPF
jgi:hypothetical protein